MQNILVLGADGFIGRHLSRKLHEAGDTVVAFDRFGHGTEYFDEIGIKTLQGSFHSESDITKALVGIDVVFHLISATTPASAENDTTIDLRQNVEPTVALLKAALSSGVKKLVFTSTGGAIYGTNSHKFTTEDTVPMPVSPYAIGKLTIENYLHYFQHKFGLECVTYRIANPYGPGQVAKAGFGAIPTFIDQIRSDEPITVMGDGSMTRDYIFIDDAVDMIVSSYKKAEQTLYNIGTGTGASILELIAEIETSLHIQANIEHIAQPKTYTQDITLDISRYENEFGPMTFTSLSDGIRRTIES